MVCLHDDSSPWWILPPGRVLEDPDLVNRFFTLVLAAPAEEAPLGGLPPPLQPLPRRPRAALGEVHHLVFISEGGNVWKGGSKSLAVWAESGFSGERQHQSILAKRRKEKFSGDGIFVGFSTHPTG